MERRGGYGFSLEAKKLVHAKAGDKCLYGNGDCPNPNTGRINHITGAFEGFLKGADRRDISNPDMNATMECSTHEAIHDAQERLIVQQLKGERIIYERRTNRGYKGRAKSSHQRSSHKRRR